MLTPFTGQHTIALGRATQGGAPCSTSRVERSDRSEGPVKPVAVQNGDDPTNARPGGTGACRVALGSAGQLGRPQTPWRREKNSMSRLEK